MAFSHFFQSQGIGVFALLSAK